MKFLRFLVESLSGAVVQIIFGGFLFITFSFIRLFLLINQPSNLPLFLETFVFACIYGLVWFYFWSIVTHRYKKYLVWKVLIATLPLIPYLLFFNPVENLMAMMPTTFEEYRFNYALFLTTLLLFPIYSMVLYKYVFSDNKNTIKKVTITFVTMFLIGLGLAYTGWTIMPMLYQSY